MGLATLLSVHPSKCCLSISSNLSRISLSLCFFISLTLPDSRELLYALWPVAKVPVVNVASLFCHCIMVIISSLCMDRKKRYTDRERERRGREKSCTCRAVAELLLLLLQLVIYCYHGKTTVLASVPLFLTLLFLASLSPPGVAVSLSVLL